MAAETHTDVQGHERWMREALRLAEQAGEAGEVPVGAVVVRAGEIIGSGFNQPIRTYDATAHAEIVAIRSASQFCNNYRLPGASLYVTIEPCTMCLGAMIHARIESIVFGAREPRAGAIVSQARLTDAEYFNHRISFTEGVLADDCAALLQNFFKSRRESN